MNHQCAQVGEILRYGGIESRGLASGTAWTFRKQRAPFLKGVELSKEAYGLYI